MREDGVGGLFRGAGPTVVRAMALNMGMLGANDQAKEMIEDMGFQKGGRAAVLGGATIAGAQPQGVREQGLGLPGKHGSRMPITGAGIALRCVLLDLPS